MNSFNQRWHELVRAARAAGESPLPEPDPHLGPFLRRRIGASPEAMSGSDDLWRWYGLRGLAASMAVLVICLAVTWRSTREPALGRPAVENAVAETFWWL